MLVYLFLFLPPSVLFSRFLAYVTLNTFLRFRPNIHVCSCFHFSAFNNQNQKLSYLISFSSAFRFSAVRYSNVLRDLSLYLHRSCPNSLNRTLELGYTSFFSNLSTATINLTDRFNRTNALIQDIRSTLYAIFMLSRWGWASNIQIGSKILFQTLYWRITGQ